MNLERFLAVRAELRAQRPSLIDLSELNVYRSLAAFDRTRFGPIAPSTHAEAPYRCHVAERFLEVLELPPELKARAQVSHGVRRSLRALFQLAATGLSEPVEGRPVLLPDDVYPVYGRLAAEAGAKVETYAARLGLPNDEALARCSALLVCEPLKPWGTTLSDTEVARLAAWSRADERRLLLLDSAYATPPTPGALRLALAEHAVLLTSLSKGWLVPDHAGLALVPTRFQRAVRQAFSALPKDEVKLRIGYAALTEHRQRVAETRRALDALARLFDAFAARKPQLGASPCVGYFATTERSFSELLALGVLGIPGSVFGAARDEGRCVLSSLPTVS